MIKRRRLSVVLLGTLFAALLLGAYGLRDRVISPFIRDWLLSTVSSELGMKLGIDEITGSYFSDIRIQGIHTVTPSAAHPLVSLEARSLEARYSILELLWGPESFLRRLEIGIDGAVLDIDINRSTTEAGDGNDATDSLFPPLLPVITVRDSRLSIKGEGFALRWSGLAGRVALPDPEGRMPVSLRAEAMAFEHPGVHSVTASMSAVGSLGGNSVQVDSLLWNEEPLISPGRVIFGPKEAVDLSLSVTALGGSGNLEASFLKDTFRASWTVADLDLARLTSVLVLPEQTLEGTVNSSGKLAGPMSDPDSVTGDLEISLGVGLINGVPIRRLLLHGTLEDGAAHVSLLEMDTGRNVLSIRDAAAPLSTVFAGDPEALARESRGAFSMDLQDIPTLLKLAGMAYPLPDDFPPHRLVLTGKAAEGTLTVEEGSFVHEAGSLRVNRLQAFVPPDGPIIPGLRLSVSAQTDIQDLGAVARTFGVREVAGQVTGKIGLEGPATALAGTLELEGNDLRYGKVSVGRISLSARGGAGGWVIDRFIAHQGPDTLTVSGTINPEPLELKNLGVDLRVVDMSTYLGLAFGETSPLPEGPLEIHLALDGPPTTPQGRFRARWSEGHFGTIDIPTAELTGALEEDFVRVEEFLAKTSEGSIVASGQVRHHEWDLPLEAVINRLILSRGELVSSLEAPATIRVNPRRTWSIDRFVLSGNAGTLGLQGSVSRETGYDVSLEAKEVQSDPWLPMVTSAGVQFQGLNLTGRVTGPVGDPVVTLSGSLEDLRGEDAPLPIAGTVDTQLSSRGVLLTTFSWKAAEGQRIDLAGTFPYDPFHRRFIPGQFMVRGDFMAPDLLVFTGLLPDRFHVPGSLKGTFSLTGTPQHPEAQVSLVGEHLRFPEALALRPPGELSLTADATLEADILTLRSFSVSSRDMSLNMAGTWSGVAPLRPGRAADDFPGTLDLKAEFSATDFGWISREVQAIRRLNGEVRGDITLQGPASRPTLQALLELSKGEFRLEGSFPSLDDLNARLSVRDRTVKVDRFTGTMGGASFFVEGGVDFPEGTAAEVDLHFQGDRILLYRKEGLRVRADADLTAEGSVNAPRISGLLKIRDGKLIKGLNWLEPLRELGGRRTPQSGRIFSFRNPPIKEASFDIRIDTAEPFIVKNNVMSGSVRPALLLRGTGEIPVLTGNVYVDPSRLMLPAGRLSLEAGVIRFLEASPDRPLLDLSGSGRFLGYDVTAVVDGPYDDPTITLSSVPPAGQDELLLLLLAGKVPQAALDGQTSTQRGMSVAVYLGRGVMDQWFGEGDLESDTSMMDRFDVMIGRGLSRQGNETIEAQFRLAEGVLREGDTLYITADRDEYDSFNTGLRILFHLK